GKILSVAMCNPLDREAIKVVDRITGLEVRIFVSSQEELEETVELVYK
ncbi:MAG: hypothetical protein JSW40_05210, partial [Candidatus Omnitrophota bacterium]